MVGGCEWGVKGAAIDDVPVNIVTCHVATVAAADLQPCNEQGVLPESSCHCHSPSGSSESILGPGGRRDL